MGTPMPLGQIYLRDREGESIGPLPVRALEVLFDARVVDDGTPLSEDGVMYRALRDFPELYARVIDVKEMLGRGEDPWAPPATPPPVARAASRMADPSSAASAPAYASARPLGAMLRTAIGKESGLLSLSSDEGSLSLHYKDGKIVVIETDIEALGLAPYLVEMGVASKEAIARGEERAPAMGGDLGGALIALGLVQPHTYFEKLLGWAKRALGSVIVPGYREIGFEPRDVPNPPIPLGLDRFGILIELVRSRADRGWLEEHLGTQRNSPLILSQVEGGKLEDMKLKAAELRAINAVNGVKTLGEIIDAMGGTEQKTLEVLQVVYFAVETGFVVLGTDPLLSKEVQEAARVRDQVEKVKRKSYFEILGVNERTSDEETRNRYTELAKHNHPDTLRRGVAPELVEAKREMFALISEAFEALTTETQRLTYAHEIEAGRAGSSDDLMKVQAVLQAETLFKKAEVLAKLKKLDEAIAMLDEAIKLKGDDTEFKVFRAFYGFLAAQRAGVPELEVEAERAIKQILALMKNDSNIAAGYMFLGQLNKVIGKQALSAKYFEKVLEYDERNPEAQREVRLHNMRAEKDKKKKWF
jgi:hypothetical protein